MARCEVCDKKHNTARKYAYRGTYVTKRTLHRQKPNIKKIRILDNGAARKAYVCTSCMRSGLVQRAN